MTRRIKSMTRKIQRHKTAKFTKDKQSVNAIVFLSVEQGEFPLLLGSLPYINILDYAVCDNHGYSMNVSS